MQALIAKGADVNKRGGEYGTALQGSTYTNLANPR
jgi:hypothetical protein